MPETIRDILTISTEGTPDMGVPRRDNWHEIVNAYRTQKVLTGNLGGIESLKDGWNVAVIYYLGFRVLIPMEEMMIDLSGDGRENADTLNRQVRIANNMLGAEVDFVIRSLDETEKSIAASRKDGMLKKRRMFYLSEEGRKPLIYPGRVVEARVIAVASKAVRLEIFGIEVSMRVRDMCWEWLADANDKYAIGDVVLASIKTVTGETPETLQITVDVKTMQPNENRANLEKCRRQGKYAGKVTDIYRGTYFIRLNIGVNAVAHSSNTTVVPAKGDDVGFVATRINLETESAEGIITRIIKQAGRE